MVHQHWTHFWFLVQLEFWLTVGAFGCWHCRNALSHTMTQQGGTRSEAHQANMSINIGARRCAQWAGLKANVSLAPTTGNGKQVSSPWLVAVRDKLMWMRDRRANRCRIVCLQQSCSRGGFWGLGWFQRSDHTSASIIANTISSLYNEFCQILALRRNMFG